MPKIPRYAHLDRLSPEQVRAFKHSALSSPPALPSRPRALAAQRAGVVIAEGDSWFDYPIGLDIIDFLRRHHGYRVRNHAQAGDTLENMVYGDKFSPMDGYRALPSRLADVLDDLRRTGSRVLLFSAGGNDIAGEEFAQFLEHAGTGLDLLRRAHARHVIDTVFRKVLTDLIDRASAASPGVHIITHGYGYPVADGRGVGVAIGLSFIGPWLRPALAAKRINPLTDGAAIITTLIDSYNDLLASLAQRNDRFHHLDLRALIGRAPSSWANELHVRNSVYASIADRFAEQVRALGAAATPRRAARPRRKRPRR